MIRRSFKMKKKILWILLLIIIIVAIVVGIFVARKRDVVNQNTTNTTFNKNSDAENKKKEETTSSTKKGYEKIELEDGILYAIDGKQLTSDIVLGDNYFDTTVNDIFLNPESYYNKNIEIEGMYLTNEPYTFVGRYSTSNLCAYCPVGYSYFEYQLKGKIDVKLVEEESWIKVIGKLKKGNDVTSNYQDYYYISVDNFEIMNEKGQDTVNN